jgi:hypothetical protein
MRATVVTVPGRPLAVARTVHASTGTLSVSANDPS